MVGPRREAKSKIRCDSHGKDDLLDVLQKPVLTGQPEIQGDQIHELSLFWHFQQSQFG
jgi:hypothetical protein